MHTLFTKSKTPKKVVTVNKYDSKGKLIESSTKTKDKDECKKIFNNGILDKTICTTKNKVSQAWKGLIILVVIALIALIIPVFTSIRRWDYARRLRLSNPEHKTFIEYVHRLFGM